MKKKVLTHIAAWVVCLLALAPLGGGGGNG